MAEKNRVNKASVVMYCICAVIWNINWILDLIYGNTDSQSFMWHIGFALVWDILAVFWILYYRKSKKDNGAS